MKRSFCLAFAGVMLVAGAMPSRVPAQEAYHRIIVESPILRTGEMIPRQYTPDGRNVSPPLTWRDLPAGTQQIVVVCEDHGAGNPPPWVHWLIYNIPASATGLPEELPIYPTASMPSEIDGAVHGNNGWGRPIYRGPAPPVGQVHHYNFVVYALDTELDLPLGQTRAEVMEAIEGHIIGRGEIVPFYVREEPADGAGVR